MFERWRQPKAETVVREHGAAVYSHLRRIFGPHADIDDVYQSVFVEIIRALPSFRGTAQLSTWIRRITWNVAYQEMRLRYRRPEPVEWSEEQDLPPPSHADVASSPETQAHERRMRALLYSALEALEPKRRVVVILCDLEGATLEQAGNILGRPLQTVASQLRAGRANLAAAFSERLTPNPRPAAPQAADASARTGRQ